MCKVYLWENPRGCNRGFKVTKSEVTTSSQVEPSSPWPHDPEPPAHPLHHLSTYGMVVLQGLFAIFAGKWAFHITCESLPSEAAWVHERRGRNLRFTAMQQQLTKKSTWLGMGSSYFSSSIFVVALQTSCGKAWSLTAEKPFGVWMFCPRTTHSILSPEPQSQWPPTPYIEYLRLFKNLGL